VLHAARCKYRTQKIVNNLPSGHHRTTLSGYIFATKARIDNRKNLSSSNISSTCPHNMVNFGPLAAEIGSVVWSTQANFNGFRVLAALLQRRRSTEANRTLHGVWPSPGLVHDIYIFGGFFPVTEFYEVQNSLCVHVLRSRILAALLHSTPAAGVSQTLRRCAQAPPTFGRATITLGIGPHSSFASIALDFVSSVLRQDIGWEERLRNDLFCVECDTKPQLDQPKL